jgi:biopolymer transport protein ExbD
MSGMEFRPARKRTAVTLNLTPLIDVLFLFIIFFTLTSTFKRVGELELRLPDSSTAQPAPAGAEALELELVATEDGRLLLDGRPLALAELKGALTGLHAASPERRVLIKAEAGVTHGEVVRLLDIVREAGFPGVGIGTERRGPPIEEGPAQGR